MSKGMLGLLALSEVRGPLSDLNEKLAGSNGPKWLADLKKFLRKQFTLLFGDSRSKEEVLAAGHYDWVGDVAKAFIASPQFRWGTKREEVDIELVEFDYDPTSEQVLTEFAKRGLEEPMEEDALRFGEKYPDVQLEFPIVFLHKTNLWLGPDGRRGVLVLRRSGAGRGLYCRWFDDEWIRDCRFAARRPRK